MPGAQVAAARPEKQEGTSLREYIESLLVTVILALFGTTFVVQAFKIPSQSMEPTLLVGDHLLVNKFIFGGRGHWYDAVLPYRAVRRGDVIVFKFPYQDHPHYVKRVIGVPGDRIKIVDQQVYLNGQKQTEPYAYHDPAAPYDPFLYNFPPGQPRRTALQHAAGVVRADFPLHARRRNRRAARTSISPWATIATIAGTAATGASSIAKPSWAARWSSTGPS